jgi:hypothetical protein
MVEAGAIYPGAPSEAPAMRLSRVKFTVRRCMTAVAIVGAILGSWLEVERHRDRYLDAARYHASYVRRIGFGSLAGLHWINENHELLPPDWSYAREGWHRSLMQKYRTAAERPWLSIEPDPPPQ